MSALASFRTAVLALLDDVSSARYTTAQIDQALRMALREYSTARPLVETYQLDSNGYRILSLPSDFYARHITKVELYDADPDSVIELPFYAYQADSGWVIETTDRTIETGEVLTITYATEHTVDDLDSAAGTTLPPEDEATVQLGAAGYAAQMRAVSRPENVNLDANIAERLFEFGESLLDSFRLAITPIAQPTAGDMPTFPVQEV